MRAAALAKRRKVCELLTSLSPQGVAEGDAEIPSGEVVPLEYNLVSNLHLNKLASLPIDLYFMRSFAHRRYC